MRFPNLGHLRRRFSTPVVHIAEDRSAGGGGSTSSGSTAAPPPAKPDEGAWHSLVSTRDPALRKAHSASVRLLRGTSESQNCEAEVEVAVTTPLLEALRRLQSLHAAVVSLPGGLGSYLDEELSAIVELLGRNGGHGCTKRAHLDLEFEMQRMGMDQHVGEWLLSELQSSRASAEAMQRTTSRFPGSEGRTECSDEESSAFGGGESKDGDREAEELQDAMVTAISVASAASSCNLKSLKALVLRNGADVNHQDTRKRTALHLAAAAGALDVCKCLVEELGASLDITDKIGNTPLDEAERYGFKEVANYLKSKGAVEGVTTQQEDSYDDPSVLLDAAGKGNAMLLRVLVRERDFDVNWADADDRTALHEACWAGELAAAKCLLEELGADASLQTKRGYTALDLAIAKQHQALVDYLSSKGLGRGKAATLEEARLASEWCIAGALGDLPRLQALAKEGSPNLGDHSQRTALHVAASEGQMDAVRCLVEELGADLSPLDRWGATPLDAAIKASHEEISRYLALRGARKGDRRRTNAKTTRMALQVQHAEATLRITDASRAEARAGLTDWHFDVTALQESSGGHALLLIGQESFSLHEMARNCNINQTKLYHFLLQMEAEYGGNPYHNSMHAADALLSTQLFLVDFDFAKRLAHLELLSGLLAAIVHDFAHPGTSNAHEVRMRSRLAVLHSDQAVLERHSIASAFAVLNSSNFNVLEGLSEDGYKLVRSLMIEVVLHTDLGRHFDFIGKLKVLFGSRGQRGLLGGSDAERPASAVPPAHGHLEVKRSRTMVVSMQDEKVNGRLVLNTAMKFADLGHTTKPFQIHEKWTMMMADEFWELGDREKALGVPVSPLCDRFRDTDIPKSQLGFLKFVCFPFFKVVRDLVDPEMEQFKNLRTNLETWKSCMKETMGHSCTSVSLPSFHSSSAAMH